MKNLFKQSDEEKNRIRGLHLTESKDKRITSILNEQRRLISRNKGLNRLLQAISGEIEGVPYRKQMQRLKDSPEFLELLKKKGITFSDWEEKQDEEKKKKTWKDSIWNPANWFSHNPNNPWLNLTEQGENIYGDPIYHIPGDRTWEYTVIEGDYWYTRKQGQDKWISLGKTGDKKWLQARCKLDNKFPEARPSQETCQYDTDEQRPDVVYEIIPGNSATLPCKCQETTDPSTDIWYKTYEECMSACSGLVDIDIISDDGDDWFIDVDISPEYGNDCNRIKACLKYAASLEQNFVNKGRWFEFIDCMKGKESKTEIKGCDGCPEWVNAGPYIQNPYDKPVDREIDNPKIQACIKNGCTKPVY